MALLNEIKTKSGFTVSYWKITDWKINQTAKSMDITLTPYIDCKCRTEGYEPVRDEVRKIRATDYSTIRSDYTDYFSPTALDKQAQEGKRIYQVMYEYIKTHDKIFENAKDI